MCFPRSTTTNHNPIHKDHDWKLFNRFPEKEVKHNQLEFGTTIRNLRVKLDLLSQVYFSGKKIN